MIGYPKPVPRRRTGRAGARSDGLLRGRPLTGGADGYAAVPWFRTEQFGRKLQMAGLVGDYHTAVVRGRPDEGPLSVFCFDARGRLLGVESVNHARDHMAARRLLAKPDPGLSPGQAADPDVDLKALSRA